MLQAHMPPLFIYDRTVAGTTPSFVPIASESHFHIHGESNQLLPILRIDSHILEYILILTANLEKTIEYRRRAIIYCSQTCHNWRIVALSIKSFWSGLVDFEKNSGEWNNELLRRSDPYPIVVDHAYPVRYDCHFITAELAHLKRIRIYRVQFEASAWDILAAGLQQPAPHIEYLDVNYTNRSATANSFILPLTLFAGDAPHLKRLEMKGCLVDFQLPVLRSLTILSVETPNPLMAPSPLEWLEHLSHLPSLTKLHLNGSMRLQDHSSIAPRTNQIELSLLSALYLGASLHNIHIFLEGLKFPVSCRLMVHCSECHPGPELDTVLLAYLHRLNYDLQLQPENCPLSIIARTSKVSICNQDHDPPFEGSKYGFPMFKPEILFLDLKDDSGSGESLLRQVLHTLQEAFPKLTSLELHLPAKHPSLIPYLGHATKLTHLCNLSATTTQRLLSQIQIIQPPDSIPLPALHTVVFNRPDQFRVEWKTAYQMLLSFLNWRRIVGHSITKILFRNCLVSDDMISKLESLGVQVDCDSSVEVVASVESRPC